MNIYKECVDRGIEVHNHCSDLYVFVTEETTNLRKKYIEETGYSVPSFVCENGEDAGKRMYEFPFQYAPFWEKRNA